MLKALWRTRKEKILSLWRTNRFYAVSAFPPKKQNMFAENERENRFALTSLTESCLPCIVQTLTKLLSCANLNRNFDTKCAVSLAITVNFYGSHALIILSWRTNGFLSHSLKLFRRNLFCTPEHFFIRPLTRTFNYPDYVEKKLLTFPSISRNIGSWKNFVLHSSSFFIRLFLSRTLTLIYSADGTLVWMNTLGYSFDVNAFWCKYWQHPEGEIKIFISNFSCFVST